MVYRGYDLDDLSFRACYCMYRKFYKKYNLDFDDVMISGYISILEHKKDILSYPEEERFFKMCYFACKGMRQAFHFGSHRSFDICSFELVSPCVSIDDAYSLDVDFLMRLYRDEMKKYPKDQRSMLEDYFFDEKSLNEIISTYKVKRKFFVDLVRKFREDFSKALVSYGYYDFYSVFRDEFTEKEVDSLRHAKHYKKNKDKKDKFYWHDLFINKLIRDNDLMINCSVILDMPLEEVKKIVFHLVGGKKFYLYQVQLLRKKLFDNKYSLEELIKEV